MKQDLMMPEQKKMGQPRPGPGPGHRARMMADHHRQGLRAFRLKERFAVSPAPVPRSSAPPHLFFLALQRVRWMEQAQVQSKLAWVG